MALYRVKPQSPSVSGSYNTQNTGGIEPLFVQEYSTYVDVLVPLWAGASLHTGIRGTLYVDDERHCHWFVDPSVSLTMTGYNWECSFTACTRHQNLYQTGCSSLGLPTEFWLPADREIRPQQALNLSATVGIPIPRMGLKIELETYYKKMSSIVEYVGTLLDFINTSYTHNAHLFQGRGNNYGVSITVTKMRGRLSGWISYSLGRALRRFNHESLHGQFPANHERIHEFKALASYELSKHWTLSGTMICASGTPFTEVNHLYLYAGHVITNYGEYNAGRLKPYMRLDLSATYKWRMRGRREQGVNLSVYNALCNKNELFKSWKITNDREIIYRPVSFMVRMMPSVSYYVKF